MYFKKKKNIQLQHYVKNISYYFEYVFKKHVPVMVYVTIYMENTCYHKKQNFQ